jgi:hypothetical protein
MNSIELGHFAIDFHYQGSYRFFSYSDVFSKQSYEILQNQFLSLPWKKKDSHFYSQYSASIGAADQNAFSLLYRSAFFLPFKKKIEQTIKVELRNEITLIAHKLIQSQEIGVHNDFCDPELGYENYRFIFQFSKAIHASPGGELTFLSSNNKDAVIKTYPYSSNMGICFEISPSSYHYVSPVEKERYTLVMYLWDKNRKYDGSGTAIIEG